MTPYYTSPDGRAVLYHGDCLDVLRHLDAGSVDAVVTDPPYGIDGGRGTDSKARAKGHYAGDWNDTPAYVEAVVVPAIRECLRIACDAVALTPGTRCLHLYPPATDMGCFWAPASVSRGPWGFATFNPVLYYGKDWRAGRGAWPSGRTVTERPEPVDHPCPKPLAAWTWLVEKIVRPGGLVLDPFAGSGTTGVAALRTGRRCILVELDEGYCEVAARRLEVEINAPALSLA